MAPQAGLKLEEEGLNNVPPHPGSIVWDVLPIWRRGVASNFSAKNQKQKREFSHSPSKRPRGTQGESVNTCDPPADPAGHENRNWGPAATAGSLAWSVKHRAEITAAR